MKRLVLTLICASALGTAGFGQPLMPPAGMVIIPTGIFHPFFPQNGQDIVRVRAFCLDAEPVTADEFLEFVRANPAWRRSQIKRTLADEAYLKDWTGDLDLGTVSSNIPVTQVSWYAAQAYAAWKCKRLPTLAEWEYAASAGYRTPDGDADRAFKADVLRWYSTPSPAQLPAVGGQRANCWGVKDLQGLVWEWTADFKTGSFAGDAGANGAGHEPVCGAGSLGSRDATDFPAFMRYGFRSSLESNYCVRNLGFRCARDL